MARYRKTSNTDSRVGRDTTPTATPTPTPSVSGRPKSNLDARIESQINASMPAYVGVTTEADVTINNFLEALNDTSLKAIGELLRKARYSPRNVKDVIEILSDSKNNFIFEDNDFTSSKKFIAALNNQLIFKDTDTGPKESIAITEYGPEQVDSWVDKWLTSEAGRTLESLSPDVSKVLRKAVKDYASGQSVTTTRKDAQGRTVTTYEPAMSEAGIAQTLEDVAGTTELYKDVERRKAFEFGDILNKTLGIGQI